MVLLFVRDGVKFIIFDRIPRRILLRVCNQQLVGLVYFIFGPCSILIVQIVPLV